MDLGINMDIEIKMNNNNVELSISKFKKMIFLYNALDNGWSIKKRNNSYIFTKKHENRQEVFDENYLSTFMKDNLNINNILN
jgi:hypothetical protein